MTHEKYQMQCPQCSNNLESLNRSRFECVPCGIVVHTSFEVVRKYPKCEICGEERAGNGYCKHKHTWNGWPGSKKIDVT